MFTIKVVEQSSGRPCSGNKVQVFFDVFFRGHTSSQYTDNEGEAHFDYDNGDGTIYVQGKKVYVGEIRGRKIVYID